MQTTNANQGSRSNDLRWFLLGEYSLSGLLPDPGKDHQGTVGLPPALVREMEIPLERMEPVEMALRSFASKSLRQMQPDGDDHHGQIRIFCQKKILEKEMKGGWGCFVVVKPKEASQADEETQQVINFYIYEEG